MQVLPPHPPRTRTRPPQSQPKIIKANSRSDNQSGDSGRTNLKHIIYDKLKYDVSGKCTNAFKILSDPEILKIAYLMIKSKPGNMTEGTDGLTLDGVSTKILEKLSLSLRSESFTPNPVRRVQIPKANGGSRPLGVGSPRDKIVQQAMKMVLEAILEPKFHNSSHGFRPMRGCHTALKEIRKWKGVCWFIEGDISKFFDTIDHHLIANHLKKYYDEPRFTQLYWKFVRAGYIEFQSSNKQPTFRESTLGVPQGSIISPILSNLVLNELDKYVDDLKKEFETRRKNAKTNKFNPTYNKLDYEFRKEKIRLAGLTKLSPEYKLCKLKIKSLIKKKNHIRSTIPNPNYLNIEYVRYADDWIIGIWGSRKHAIELKEKIKNFLMGLQLNLSEEKTLISNAFKGAHFLGTFLRRPISVIKRVLKNNKWQRQRLGTGKIHLLITINKLIKKLCSKNIMSVSKSKSWEANSVVQWIPLPDRDIVLRYLYIMRGIYQYYSFADNLPLLEKIHWILKASLKKTLCRKHRISYHQFLQKYKKDVMVNFTRSDGTPRKINFLCPNLQVKPMNFGISPPENPFAFLEREIRTIYPFGLPCGNCGSDNNVEMHHVKHIRTINTKLTPFEKLMSKINRKQVPLCHHCHRLVHEGKYSGLSLRYLKKT